MKHLDAIPGRAHTPEQKRAIIERLYAIWMRVPTLRLAQLISISANFRDIFYVEDEALLSEIESFVNGPEEEHT